MIPFWISQKRPDYLKCLYNTVTSLPLNSLLNLGKNKLNPFQRTAGSFCESYRELCFVLLGSGTTSAASGGRWAATFHISITAKGTRALPFAPTDPNHWRIKTGKYEQRTHLAGARANKGKIQFPRLASRSMSSSPPLSTRLPSFPLTSFISLWLCIPSIPLLHLSFSPTFSLSVSLYLSIPVVAKAMVFCGGSWLGLICQAADLPSLLFSSFSCSHSSSPSFLLFSVVKKNKKNKKNPTQNRLIFTLKYPEHVQLKK